MADKYCSNCGQKNKADAVVCRKCNTPFPGAEGESGAHTVIVQQKKSGGCFKWIGIAVVAIIVLIIAIIIIATATGGSHSSSGPTATAAPDNSSATSAPAPAKSSKGPVTVLNLSGSGIHTTQTFTVPDAWDMAWTYNCASLGSSGNFIVDVYNSDATPNIDDAGVNQLGKSGNGVEHFHSGGKLYLSINSECTWTVKATG